MIRRKTVIVVGAGASNDLNLPLGEGLQRRISELLNATGDIWQYLNSASLNHFGVAAPDRAQMVADKVREQHLQILHSPSIDNFLDQNKDDPDLVNFLKMVIAYAIAEAEQKSKLSGNRKVEEIIHSTSDYFLHDFMNIAIRGHQKGNIGDSLSNLTFVIFNYDRCVERYLDHWMKFRFGIQFDWRDIAPKFIHVYGSLGNYFDGTCFNPFVYGGKFAFQNPHMELPNYVNKLKVFTEDADSSVRLEISRAIDEAETIAFFGFGFEEQNMKYFEGQGRWITKKVFATTFGMSQQNGNFIKEKLANQFSSIGRFVHSYDGKSKGMISDLYHPLAEAVGSI